MKQGVACQTIWKYEEVGHNQEGKKEIKSLFPDDVPFDTPKPSRLINRVIELTTEAVEYDLVLDFFAGSGTSGHATYFANARDGGNRKFILVQLPELIEGGIYTNIAEVTKERLRRSGAKIKAENPEWQGDTGFRVFKLDTSNIRAWNPDPDNLELSLFNNQDHILEGRSEIDILYELLLKRGLDLCTPIEQRDIQDITVHSVGGGVLLACLAEKINSDEVEALAEGILNWSKEYALTGDSTCVFRDSAFTDDVSKVNMAAILQQHGIANVFSI